MTGNEFQKCALRTATFDDSFAYKPLVVGALGLAGESGEVADHVKKFISQGHELDRDHVAEELGDITWYVAVTAHAIGWKLDDIFELNKNKLEMRYPNGFDPERSIHRD